MDIKTKSFNVALNTLKALNAQFVIEFDGTTHSQGDLVVAQKKVSRRSKSAVPYGTYKKIVLEQGIDKMQVGDVFVFDPKGTNVESIRSTVIHQADKLWGKHSITTTLANGQIEALRIV
jgi:hypothetical protein